MLEVHDLHTYYSLAHVLRGVSVNAVDGGVVALLGRNGAGKTTLVSSVMNLPPAQVRAGSIRYRGRELVGLASHDIARLGIGLVPQGRRVYRSLTVLEHLQIAARQPRDGANSSVWDLMRVFTLSTPGGAETTESRRAQRRRAADAGDRTSAHDQSPGAADGRAVGGGWHRLFCSSCRSACWS
jgi:ABC-type branched-subunit amino acid transport system ATPase component